MSVFSRSTRARVSTTLLGGLMAGLAACSSDTPPSAPAIPTEPRFPAQFRQSQVVFDVSIRERKISVSIAGNSMNGNGSSLANPSLLGKDVISISTSNYSATGVGQGGAPAGRVRVRFDVAIQNLLSGVQMITPTFPTPPAGQTGVFMFPFLTTVTNTGGGVSVEDGNQVVIETPGYGVVTPSIDFDGAPHNFFNDDVCPAGQTGGEGGGTTVPAPGSTGSTGQAAQTDCFRWERYPSIPGTSTAAARTVGFDVDPTVQQFRVRMLVAADLQNAVTPTGSVGGVVSSAALGGPVAGAIIQVAGIRDTTDASGAYSIAGVNIGAQTVTLIGFTAGTYSAGCAFAGSNITVSTGINTANVALTGCIPPPVPTGTVNGSVTVSGAATSVVGTGIILAVDGPSTYRDTVLVIAGNTFSFPGVPVNQATAGRVIGFTNLPANCTAPAPAAGTMNYSGLTDGGTVSIAAIAFTCSIAYPAVYSWQTGGALTDTLQLTVAWNMGASDLDPANNGTNPDRLVGMTYRLTYNDAALEPVEGLGGSAFSTFSANLTFSANQVSIIGLTSGNGATANQGTNVVLARIKFVRRTGFAGSLTGLTSTGTVVNAQGTGGAAIATSRFVGLTPPNTP
jgi:hypothetical protein